MMELVKSKTTAGLNELLQEYVTNKAQLDELDKLCKEQNAKIKTIMQDLGISEFPVEGGYVAKRIESTRETVNEPQLMEILKQNNCDDGIIKTKPYVDFDALEDALYHEELPKDVVPMLNKAWSTQTIVSLKIV